MTAGLFITLYDEKTVRLYLTKGIYGFLMSPTRGYITARSRHFHALADYACARDGTHVFFFLKRHIVYAGHVIGSKEYGSFILNGQDSPLGLEAKAPLCWDETKREGYNRSNQSGVLTISDKPEIGEKNQPYLIRFFEQEGLIGKYITSDNLYWVLGDYSYPLPSNSIQDMSFCTLTPGETRITLDLIRNYPDGYYEPKTIEQIDISKNFVEFCPNYGIQNLAEAFANKRFVNEAHLEASVIANPLLLPSTLRPQEYDDICRQVPISPFKPAQMDRADICYYSSKDPINDGTIPNVIIELKNSTASQAAVIQIQRYLDWLYRIIDINTAKKINAYIFAPNFTKNIRIDRYKTQIELIKPGSLF